MRRLFHSLVILAALALLIACALLSRTADDTEPFSTTPQLCVANNGFGPAAVRDARVPGARLGTLHPGETRCFRLLPSATLAQIIVTQDGVTEASPLFDPALSACWRLRLQGQLHYDMLGLQPMTCPT